MSYTIHTTPAIVLGTRTVGEGSALVDLYTSDLGRVRARAQSMREISSKMRFALQTGSITTVDLVRGREYWRLTGSHSVFNITADDITGGVGSLVGQCLSLLKRYVHGSDPHPELYESMREVLDFAIDQEAINDNQHKALEIMLAVRILFHLGYWSDSDDAVNIVDGDMSDNLLSQIYTSRKKIITHINKILQESHL